MTDESSPSRATQLLLEWRGGRAEALELLMPMVYDELRRIARAHMARERLDHSLQPTEVVHEAFARLVNLECSLEDRTHFLSMASRLMRRVLVDHARARASQKRGADADHVEWDEAGLAGALPASQPQWGVMELDRALQTLEEIDERQCRMVEYHYFGGLSYDEIAEVVGVSPATVGRDLRHARVWLRDAIEKERS